jgi:hypothetical protein
MPYREILNRQAHQEPDKVTPRFSRSPIWSWRAGTEVITVTLSCGHTKEYRGRYSAPKHKALCKECPNDDQRSG